MSTERAGATTVINIGEGVRLEIAAVYPNQDPNADPVGYLVNVWNLAESTEMTKAQVRALLGAFGGVPNLWS